MPLTPADIRNVAFSKPPIGKRGYNEEVDAFLDLLGAELARLIEQSNDLRNLVAQRDRQLRAAVVDNGRDLRDHDARAWRLTWRDFQPGTGSSTCRSPTMQV